MQAVASDQVPVVWPTVCHWLQESPIFQGVDHDVQSGKYTLLVSRDNDAVNGCGVVCLMPDKTLFIIEIGGKGLVTKDALHALADYASDSGATALKAMAHPAAARLYRQVGMKTTYELMDYPL